MRNITVSLLLAIVFFAGPSTLRNEEQWIDLGAKRVQFLRGNGIGNGDPDLIDEMQKLLPQTDARTRRTATELFSTTI